MSMRAKGAGPFRGRGFPKARRWVVPWRSSELEVDERRAAVAADHLDQQQGDAGEHADGPGRYAVVDAVELLEQLRAGELDQEPERDQRAEEGRQQRRRLRPVGEARQEVGGTSGVVGAKEDPAQTHEV